MPQREIAEGCSMCHTNQNKCDMCHTRHEFSAAESRQPEACATCHSGVDHNNWEAYSISKHGKIVSIMGDRNRNWEPAPEGRLRQRRTDHPHLRRLPLRV